MAQTVTVETPVLKSAQTLNRLLAPFKGTWSCDYIETGVYDFDDDERVNFVKTVGLTDLALKFIAIVISTEISGTSARDLDITYLDFAGTTVSTDTPPFRLHAPANEIAIAMHSFETESGLANTERIKQLTIVADGASRVYAAVGWVDDP